MGLQAVTVQSPYNKPPVTGAEAAAREWRYAELANMAAQAGCTAVVTGHTLNDRAETLLLNLARGAGTAGLTALSWSRPLMCPGSEGSNSQRQDRANSTDDSSSRSSSSRSDSRGQQAVRLVRPLLLVTREQTGRYCEEQGLQVWEDSTNSDPNTGKRNRVRMELLPLLSTTVTPATLHCSLDSAAQQLLACKPLAACAEQLLDWDRAIQKWTGVALKRCSFYRVSDAADLPEGVTLNPGEAALVMLNRWVHACDPELLMHHGGYTRCSAGCAMNLL
jgi:tRNA(Ile)-lysidine synthase TilS/MesJ